MFVSLKHIMVKTLAIYLSMFIHLYSRFERLLLLNVHQIDRSTSLHVSHVDESALIFFLNLEIVCDTTHTLLPTQTIINVVWS